MTENSNQYPMRVVIPIAVSVMFGMSAGRAVETAAMPSIGYWGALLVNMLTSAGVAVLIYLPLSYCLKKQQPES